MGGTRFMVQWEEHPSHLATRLGQLLEHQTLVDVTLMCNTHTLRVHRAVLAACSPYFESILQRQLGAHPLIVLKDMQFSVLKSLIEFMYCGETSVTEDNLGSLLQAAKFFQVKGLSSMTKEALGLPASPAKQSTVNGDFAKKGQPARPQASTKRMGMQTTLVSTAEVMNKQFNCTTTTANSTGVQSRIGSSDTAGLRVSGAQGTSNITTDTAQLLLNLSGADAQSPQQSIQAGDSHPVQVLSSRVTTSSSSQSRPMLQMSSRNVRLSNFRGPSMVKLDTKGLSDKTKIIEGTTIISSSQPENVDTPRRRGRPLKKQINVMFQEKVMTDAEIALQKEADASRLALEALKKEMNTGDPGNAAAVAAELVEAEARAQEQQQQQEEMEGKEEPSEQEDTQTVMETDGDGSQPSDQNSSELVYQVTADGHVVATSSVGCEGGSAGNVSTYMEALKEAGLPTDLPILLDSGDGSYVTVNEEVLMNICNGGVLHYQVAEGNLVQDMDGQVVVQEGDADEQSTAQEEPQPQPVKPIQKTNVIQPAPEVKPMGRRTNRVVTPPGGCGFTTARQIVKASMDKYRQEQAGMRKFVVKEMQAAELIMEADDQQPDNEDEQQDEQQEHEEQHQLLVSASGESTLVQEGGQVQALLQTLTGDGEGQQEMVYLVTENADEVIAHGSFVEGTHGFAVVADGSSVDGAHTFSLEDGSIVVQEGQVDGEMSVEQALEAMMGGSDTSVNEAATAGSSVESRVVESGGVLLSQDEQSAVVDAKSMHLVLGPDSDDKTTNSVPQTKSRESASLPILTDDAKLESDLLDDLNQDAISSPSKDIPLAVGLLPLRTALEKIQSIPEHQPRKMRSASISGEGTISGKRKSESDGEGAEKRSRTEDTADADSLSEDRFDTEEENVTNFVDQSLDVIMEDGIKEEP